MRSGTTLDRKLVRMAVLARLRAAPTREWVVGSMYYVAGIYRLLLEDQIQFEINCDGIELSSSIQSLRGCKLAERHSSYRSVHTTESSARGDSALPVGKEEMERSAKILAGQAHSRGTGCRDVRIHQMCERRALIVVQPARTGSQRQGRGEARSMGGTPLDFQLPESHRGDAGPLYPSSGRPAQGHL